MTCGKCKWFKKYNQHPYRGVCLKHNFDNKLDSVFICNAFEYKKEIIRKEQENVD